MAKKPAKKNVKKGTTVKVPSARTLALRSGLLKYGLPALLVVTLVGGSWGLWKWNSLYRGMPDLPEVGELWNANREAAIEFVDRQGNTLAIRGPRYGRAVNAEDLPAHIGQAFIASEDKRFYEHDGADEAAIARAVWSNARAGETVSGASTLTQQLIKNLVLNSRQTMERKAQEMKLARQLETKLDKSQILSLYLNRVYFGAGLYGVDAASRFYYGKPPADMTIAEAALLAALPKAPSKLNLRDNLEGAKDRQAYVLGEMVDLGFITAEQATAARDQDITIINAPTYDAQLGYVLDTVQDRVKSMLPTVPGDLVVTVTIDPDIQAKTHAALKVKLDAEGPDLSATQVGAVVMAADGAVTALIGGLDYTESEFNRVTQARRQPGSSFKPFVYAAALEANYSPYDVRVDEPIIIDKWTPENYGGGYLGPMTLSEAIARSTNTVAATIGHEIGENRVVALARRFGISSKMEAFPSISLGSQEVTPWELTRAYGALQSGGLRMDPYLIETITDSRGVVLYQRPEYDRERVFDEGLSRDMNAMLSRVVNDSIGTGARARIAGWDVAGKTGTSQDWRDAWFVGYTGAYVGAVWVGNDDDSAMARVSGGGLPSDLWSDMMDIVHAGEARVGIPGAGQQFALSDAAEQRIAFYRGMNQAFSAVSRRGAGEDARTTVSQRN